MTGYAQTRDRWRTRAVEWVLFALAYAFMWLTRWVPIWTLTGTLAPLGGWLAILVPAARRRVLGNLDHVWPDLSRTERRRILRATGSEFMRLMIEYAHFDKINDPAIALEIEGLDHLTDACKTGKGVVLVSAHFGNWEAVRLAAKRAGCPSGIIYRAFNNRYLDAYTMELIAGLGAPVLQKGRSGMRRLVAHVARGGVVMILVDQRNSGAPRIPFLGQPAETVPAAAELAARTGAALIPAMARRDAANRRFSVSFEPQVPLASPEAMMVQVNARIGRWVETTPEQWFWFHRRWKTVPERGGGGPG